MNYITIIYHTIFICSEGYKFLFYVDDLSFEKHATQYPSYIGQQYQAENAVDRNPTTCMRTHEVGPNSDFQTTWWKVDLGRIVNIYRIHILFKSYYGEGMNCICISNL